jgi:mono/diheme cytochrome c family protein
MQLAFVFFSVLLAVGHSRLAAAFDASVLYKEECARCHGDTSHSDTATGKAMKVPELAGNQKLQKISTADFAAIVRNHPRHAPRKGLNDSDAGALAAYVKQLAGK